MSLQTVYVILVVTMADCRLQFKVQKYNLVPSLLLMFSRLLGGSFIVFLDLSSFLILV